MEISVSQIYRVREGKRRINQKFIVGAIKAFPNYGLDDLFYLVPELPTVNNHRHQHSTTPVTDKLAPQEKEEKPDSERRREVTHLERTIATTSRATPVLP